MHCKSVVWFLYQMSFLSKGISEQAIISYLIIFFNFIKDVTSSKIIIFQGTIQAVYLKCKKSDVSTWDS